MQTTLGHVLDCRQTVTKTSTARWWRLCRGLGALLKRKDVTGATVDKIPCVCTLSLGAVATCSRFFDNLQVCSVKLSEPHPDKTHSRNCQSSHGTSVRHLHLVDNMSVALAFERRRAHVHRLLVNMRRFTCLRRCGGYRLSSTPQTRVHGSMTFSTMQVNQCWPGWKENAHIVPHQTAVRQHQTSHFSRQQW